LGLALLPVYLLQRLTLIEGWTAILGAVLLSVVLYLAILWFYTATEDEKSFLSRIVGRD
jgi:hypothetical protein